jgi:hypothetical protein
MIIAHVVGSSEVAVYETLRDLDIVVVLLTLLMNNKLFDFYCN